MQRCVKGIFHIDMPELSFGVSVCAQVTSPMRPALPSTKSSRRPDRFAESAGWRWKWCNFSDLGSTSTIPVTTGLWYLYILCGFLSISLSLSLAGASQGVVSESTGLVSRLFKSKSLEYFQNLPKPTKHCCPQSASSWMCAILPHPFFISSPQVHQIQLFDSAEGYGGGTSEERLHDLRHLSADEKRRYQDF